MSVKKRLDILLVERQLAASREEARCLIDSGTVCVNGIIRKSCNSQHDEGAKISLYKERQFVSRGGQKLEGALTKLAVRTEGCICLDVGSSTGGFTDCLLQHGAKKVYAVDVGYGILDWKLRQDKRVVVMERTNARYLSKKEIQDWIELCVIDASFISLDLLLEPVLQFFKKEVTIVALVKPQFQLPREKIEAGGVVRNSELQLEALKMVQQYAATIGLEAVDTVASPIRGAKGNQEFFMLLK